MSCFVKNYLFLKFWFNINALQSPLAIYLISYRICSNRIRLILWLDLRIAGDQIVRRDGFQLTLREPSFI